MQREREGGRDKDTDRHIESKQRNKKDEVSLKEEIKDLKKPRNKMRSSVDRGTRSIQGDYKR